MVDKKKNYRYSLSGIKMKYSFSIVDNRSSVVMISGVISVWDLANARKIVKKMIEALEVI